MSIKMAGENHSLQANC